MQLQAGYRFRTAPRFHRDFDWADRLRLNDGVDAADPALPPRPGWRPPTPAELALLVDDTADGVSSAEHILTFSLPAHLRARWWDLADRLAEAPAGDSPDYQTWVRDVASLLTFKGLPLPPRCAFDVVLSAAPEVAPASPGPAALVAAVNLADGPASLVFLNLPPHRVARLIQALGTQGEPAGPERRFLAAFPDYPLTRLTLGPGEGVWLPAAGGVFRRQPVDGQEFDVWLVIREAEGERRGVSPPVG